MRFTILTALATMAGSAAAGVIGAQAGGSLSVAGGAADQLVGPSGAGGVVAGSGTVVAGAQVVVQIQVMGNISASLLQPAQQLSITNAPALLFGAGPWAEVILGFGKLITTITTFFATLVAAPKAQFAIEISAQIGLAFELFVEVFGELLSILIAKASFLVQIPFVGIPVAAVLRSVATIIDQCFNLVISLVAGPAAAVMKANLGNLDGTMQKAVTCYS